MGHQHWRGSEWHLTLELLFKENFCSSVFTSEQQLVLIQCSVCSSLPVLYKTMPSLSLRKTLMMPTKVRIHNIVCHWDNRWVNVCSHVDKRFTNNTKVEFIFIPHHAQEKEDKNTNGNLYTHTNTHTTHTHAHYTHTHTHTIISL